MNNKIGRLIFIVGLLTASLTACHDDDDDVPSNGQGGSWNVAWSNGEEETEIGINGRYYSLYATLTGQPDSTLTITTDAEWLDVVSETLPADGIIQVLAKENTGGASRTADLVVTDAKHKDKMVVLHIRQQGLADVSDSNSDGDIMADYSVGWGFNAFEEYKNLNSQRGKILDASKLQRYDSDSTFLSIQEAVRSLESFNVHSTWSLQEMSSVLTKEMTSQTNVLFVKKTTRRFQKVCTNSVRESACSYARLQKTVATRSIDEGVLKYFVNDRPSSEMPFTPEFRQYYDRVRNSRGSEREKAIEQLIEKYGTHLIVSASLGCKMDLVLTFDKSQTYELKEEAKEVSSKIFGRSSAKNSKEMEEHLTCDLSSEHCVQISGGSAETRSALETLIKKLNDVKQLDGTMVRRWMASVSPADIEDPAKRSDLDVVDFRFMPVWDLFPDVDAKNAMIEYVLEMSKRSDCGYTDHELGTDNYRFILKGSDYAKFDTSSDATLVRVARYEGVPVMEICQEYVPKIRSDRRVTVYYPILEGRSRIGQGIFPGDGDNPPAMLTFSGDDVYVYAFNNYGQGDIIDTLYYVHGNLYVENYGIPTAIIKPKTTNEYFTVWAKNTPIVKIGGGYWTRKNVQESLEFGIPYDEDDPDGYYYIYEEFNDDGMLFANIFYGNSGDFRWNNPGLFDAEVDEGTGFRMHWYVPMVDDIRDLESYIGQNTKSLFPGQVSGFDAQFAGYFGYFDDLNNGKSFGKEDYHYVGEYCFLAAKDHKTTGEALVLSPDYTIKHCAINKARDNYYPIRAFRMNYHTYPVKK